MEKSEQYFGNFIADAVIRVLPDGRRYIKYEGKAEFLANKESKVAYGGVGFGEFHVLTPITKEEYDTFSISWRFGSSGKENIPV